jgi:large subunit ribosomal protein L4
MSADTAEATTFKVPSKGPGGEDKGELSISSEQFDSRVRYRLIKEAVVMHAANKRQGNASTRTRADIRGSTSAKPWRQKGTGHARAGTRKSPIWRGGGVVFGPHPRDYSYSINKKQRRLALRSSLFSKFRDGEVQVLDGLHLDAPKTRQLATSLAALGLAETRILIGTAELDSNLVLSARNLRKVKVSTVAGFNTADVIGADVLVLTPAAFQQLADGAALGDSAGGEES